LKESCTIPDRAAPEILPAPLSVVPLPDAGLSVFATQVPVNITGTVIPTTPEFGAIVASFGP
jgi:hypothetical protein